MNRQDESKHYKQALDRINYLMKSHTLENSAEYKEMDMLVSLVEAF